MNRRFYFIIALVVFTIWAVFYIVKHEYRGGPKIEAMAPDFTLENAQHQKISLSSLRGKVVLLNFWASWCGPCQQEMPSIEALYQKFKDRGFVVLGVSLDEEGWPAIQSFLNEIKISFPIINDKDQSVSELYQTFRVPETYLIDTQGKIVSKIVGPQDYNQEVFFQKVERLLPKS